MKILIALIAGIFFGLVTGLIPGLHVNTICVVALAMSEKIIGLFGKLEFSCFIISMSITNSFTNAIPAIFLGAPSGETESLIILPGHRMLLEGKGNEAVNLTVLGSILSLFLSIILTPLLILLFVFINEAIKKYVGYVILGFVLFVTLKGNSKLKNMAFFLLSGILGIFSLGLNNDNVLLPLLSGLFGISSMVLSLNQNVLLPKQEKTGDLNINNKMVLKAIIGASLVASIAAFLPGFGGAQSAILAQTFLGNLGNEGFLVLTGGINTANMVISIDTFYSIGKARNGAIVAITSFFESINLNEMLIFLFTSLAIGGFSGIVTVFLSKKFSELMAKLNYRLILISIIVFLTALTFATSGLVGIIILISASALGICASLLTVGKNNLMGCLILPVLIYFLW
jgi:putative membrane protein